MTILIRKRMTMDRRRHEADRRPHMTGCREDLEVSLPAKRGDNPPISLGQSRLLSVGEVAHLLGVSKKFIYERTSSEHPDYIPNLKIGPLVRFVAGEVQDWVERHRS